jgi:hypothetical protein
VTYVSNSNYSQAPCAVASVPVPIAFNTATGHLRASLLANASTVGPCTGSQSGAQSYLDYFSPTFRSPSGGIHVIRLDWWLDWQANLTAHTAVQIGPNVGTAAGYSWNIQGEILDLTTGGGWAAGTFSNGSQVENGSLHVAENSTISLPDVIVLTQGDLYQYYFTVQFSANVWSGAGAGNSASTQVAIGTFGTPTMLDEVAIT